VTSATTRAHLDLDRFQAGLWPRAAGGDTEAISAVRAIIDRRAKLLGLGEQGGPDDHDD